MLQQERMHVVHWPRDGFDYVLEVPRDAEGHDETWRRRDRRHSQKKEANINTCTRNYGQSLAGTVRSKPGGWASGQKVHSSVIPCPVKAL